jgi:hypothetical protein
MDFLGHRLTQDGMARQATKVDAIQQWAMPTTQAEVRSFISVIGYYSRFVDGFAGVEQPLTDLLREGQFEYPMPLAAQAAFLELRARPRATLLKYFDPCDETKLWTDASGTAVGGAVLQRDTLGNLWPVAYYTRCHPPARRNTQLTDKLLAIRDCLLAFQFYLVGLQFDARLTIAHYSEWLTEQAENSPLQSRWYTVFLEYNIKEIQYVKGEKNALADALSRHPDPSSQQLDHLVPPFNMDVVGFHGLSTSVATADQHGVHQLPVPQDLFGVGAIVQPVAPPDCPIMQV